MEGFSYQTISSFSGYSVSKLETNFHRFLSQTPPVINLCQPKTEEAYLLIDGLWFGKKFCLMLYRQAKSKLLFHASFMPKEWGFKIAKDLLLLEEKGYRFTGVVSDGGTGIRKAIFKVLGHIPHQICLAHLHRDVINAIGRYPKDERVKELKKLADHLWLIESKEALRWWEGKLKEWTAKNREYLRESHRDETGRWWFIHHGVRKAVRVLVSMPNTSFKFLDRPLMPKTTNALEGSISVLSRKHLVHRGLKEKNLKPFLLWFIYFYNRKLLSQRKT